MLLASCAFSPSLVSPSAPGQINMITPMLHPREVRLRKITWPPQATQVVEPEFQTRTASLEKLGSCQRGRVRTPPPAPLRSPGLGQRSEAGPCSPEGWRGDPLQGGKSGQGQLFIPPGWEEPGVITRRLAPQLPPRAPWEGQTVAESTLWTKAPRQEAAWQDLNSGPCARLDDAWRLHQAHL